MREYGVQYDDIYLPETVDVDVFSRLESAVARFEFALMRAEEEPMLGELLYKNPRIVTRDGVNQPWVEMTDKMIEEITQ